MRVIVLLLRRRCLYATALVCAIAACVLENDIVATCDPRLSPKFESSHGRAWRRPPLCLSPSRTSSCLLSCSPRGAVACCGYPPLMSVRPS